GRGGRRRPHDDPLGGAVHQRDHRHRHDLRLHYDQIMSQPAETRDDRPRPDLSGAPNIIEVKGLVTHYGTREILHGVDFSVREGEIMVIMGGSGSGKSTLLSALLGLLRPTTGSIRILDEDITRISEVEKTLLRRKLGVAFQGGALFG